MTVHTHRIGRARGPIAVALAATLTMSACGSRLPDEVLAQMDEAALGGRAASLEPGQPGAGSDLGSGSSTTTPGPGATIAGGSEDGSGGESSPGAGGPTITAGSGSDGDNGAGAAGENCSGGATDVGVTSNEIKVASIVTASGPLPGATEGAYRGAAAYFEKINAEGGICGRKLTLLKGDDGLDPQRARGEFLRLEPGVLGFVAPFAVADSGYIDLIESTGVPYLGTSVEPAGRELPTVVPRYDSRVSHSGPFVYFRQAYPEVANVGFLYTDVGGVRTNAPSSRVGLQKAGFNLVYDSGAGATSPDYTPEVINLRRNGAQMVYLFAFELNMHVRFARNMRQQNFEPVVKVANIAYNSRFIELLGDVANGWTNHITHLPAINPDEPARSPALTEFLTWHDRVFPGSQIDLFPITGWGDAARFVRALRQLGPDVTRDKLIEAVDSLPDDDGGGIFAPTKPAEHIGTSCFVIARVENQVWTREHPASGYECNLGERFEY